MSDNKQTTWSIIYVLNIGNTSIKQVKSFNYLGSMITEDGKCDSEIKKRIFMSRQAFQKLAKLLKDRKMSIETKKRRP